MVLSFLFIQLRASMTSLAMESPLSSFSSVKPGPSDDLSHGVPKDWKFWCIIFSLALSILLTAIEFVGRLSMPKRLDKTFEFTDL